MSEAHHTIKRDKLSYLDRLEEHTGLKANRGMIARRALALFLASHTVEDAPDREG
jgi:hypothetical protein